VRPPASPVGMDLDLDVETEIRGGAVLAELNSSERLQQRGEFPETLVACTQKPPSLPAACAADQLAPPRPAVRDQRRAELSAAAVASVRLPADRQTPCENLQRGTADCLNQDSEASSPNDVSGELSICEGGEVSIEAEVEHMDSNALADMHAVSAEPGLHQQVIRMSMPSGNMQDPGPLMPSFAPLSPLSPIREVAEGSTPKATGTREVLEMQASPAQSGIEVRGQLDLQDESSECEEDDGVGNAADPLAQMPTSKERYLQIRDRFLSK